ncbi:hypothetical protein NHH03_08380 [Stieleria sp. TO1_6]|uniref:hypothetical protein n=1 Tax=Stieleria tagensis TaxID=2956795 RepID=UPI00209B78DB|nr:hypothetical protein [Stieleria tagensis]MCO8121750.1 hypothetical protein [Stieleria tagensis]
MSSPALSGSSAASKPFHIHLYGPPADRLTSGNPTTAPLPSSFEAAWQRLQTLLPQALLEPDGSLAWSGEHHQIVGMLYDAADRIQYVELRGFCYRQQVQKLLRVIAGIEQVDRFSVMVLPERQWKNFQSFANSLLIEPAI